ncbi:MAG: 4-hydroxy-3-methylbut-2-enyl diphosphate reductase, partial [Lentisphaeria bacterium]|nr:4-hydroxy-3-methylbut-2-enyl diphosphate reductase [Lentisphaeria bacterium]
ERQQAVLDLIRLKNIDQLLVIGSPHSSNSQRLCETARRYDVPALLIDDPESIRQMNFDQTEALGITAGASAPELLLEKALEILTTQHNFIISGE